jgi:hypothetical protein
VSPSPHPKTETVPVSETLCFLVIYTSGRLTKSTNPVILSAIHHHEKLLESNIHMDIKFVWFLYIPEKALLAKPRFTSFEHGICIHAHA